MEKSNSFMGKLSIIIFTFMILFGFGNIGTTSLNGSGSDSNSSANLYLMGENFQLRQEYEKLTKRLNEMETYVNKIKKYDNIVYSQLLGVDYDTTGFNNYNKAISFELRSCDSIFSEVDERTMYAAEMLATELIKLQETSNLFKKNKNAILFYPTISPIKTKDFIEISSPFGYREHPIKGEVLFHEGIDISANIGTEIHATAQGKVISIMYSKYGYGNRVVIQHAYGFETLYAHMDTIRLKKGQWVNKNQIIGTVGNTGLSTGSHLHYEIHKNNQPRDPLGYFYVSIGEELLAIK